ncbi:MAG: chromosome partitioning protein ParB, partial [Bacillota bacterium]|nr:chromosome partitioning protein ParB [Bacillota bacterium]
TIFMCDSNLQRTTILPSEKAFAYKMRLEAMNRQGKRTDLTSGPVGQKFSREELADSVGESGRQVSRYIRLTELIPEILELVDGGTIKMRPAVEISYLPKDLQLELYDNMEMEACTPSHDQTLRMRRLLADDKLTPEVITAIMQEEKPNQKEKIVLKDEEVQKHLPKGLKPSDRKAYIYKALDFYGKHLKKQRDHER